MELKFSERYNEIISNAKQRNWNKEYCKQNFIYSELHHVVPKSIDASLINEDTNLVYLTGAEHFEAHKELAIYNQDNKKIVNAFWRMSNLTGEIINKKGYQVTPEDYETARKLFAENESGENNPSKKEEIRKKISASLKGKPHPWCSGENNWTKTPEGRALMSELSKQIDRSYMRGENNWNFGKIPVAVEANKKPVVCVEHPEIYFESQADAQRKSKELGWKGVRGSHIGSVINGNRKYCGTDTEGNCLHWKRKES